MIVWTLSTMPTRNRQHTKSRKELKESKLAALEKNASEVWVFLLFSFIFLLIIIHAYLEQTHYWVSHKFANLRENKL